MMELYVYEERCERCGRVSDSLKKTEFMLRAGKKEMDLCDTCIEELKKKFTAQSSRLAMLYLKSVNRFVARPRCAVCSGQKEDLFVYKFDIGGSIYELELCEGCFSKIMTMYRRFHWELPVERIGSPQRRVEEAMAL